MKQVRINIRTLANSTSIRREKRNGRDVIIVPSATLPDNVVMNEIMYPADEIEKSYVGLNRKPAPLGHPTINGKFVSASDPEGLNMGWIGAWNENVRRENGRVLLDKVIDVETANRSEGGKAVLAAISKGDPIHTSTGLYCMMEAANGDVPYKNIARDIVFDHDAILLDEEGAATPEQGVGMLVNSKGEQEEVEVINSAIDDADRDLDWALDSAARALEKRQRAPLIERMKAALIEAFSSEREPSANRKEDDMTVEEQIKALSAKVDTLSEGAGKVSDALSKAITDAVTNAVKPLVDAQAEMVASQKAKDDAEKAELVDKIVKANVLSESAAKELTLNALKELAPKAVPGKAAPLNSAFKPNVDGPSFKLPEGDK
ncbi:hypothetical protein [Phyllobacterium calauticae]|jgi:hypothetical protein|uniref:hypothetical protein n=1 Tax=Phyllobacterium calauticae TaxID=2817027 RepID=UPI001CBF9357|nr:hypothetical protein [Phyllobacterium calauticae]MBZ3690997.1 hypothetical protein [Phyllobacterium calauticae]